MQWVRHYGYSLQDLAIRRTFLLRVSSPLRAANATNVASLTTCGVCDRRHDIAKIDLACAILHAFVCKVDKVSIAADPLFWASSNHGAGLGLRGDRERAPSQAGSVAHRNKHIRIPERWDGTMLFSQDEPESRSPSVMNRARGGCSSRNPPTGWGPACQYTAPT